MELVLDANILLAAFLKKSATRELLLDERLTLFTPEWLLSETHKVVQKKSLQKRIQLTSGEIEELLNILTHNVQVVEHARYSGFLKEASLIAPHPEDAPYLALALHLKIPIWSNDLGLRAQQKVKVYGTKDLLKELQKR